MDCSWQRLDQNVVTPFLFGAGGKNNHRRHRPTRDIGRVNVLPSLYCILQPQLPLLFLMLLNVLSSRIDHFEREKFSIESNKDLYSMSRVMLIYRVSSIRGLMLQ